MSKKIEFLWLIAGLLIIQVSAEVDEVQTNRFSSETLQDFLKLAQELGKTNSISELSQDKNVRSQLRKFVGTLRSVSKLALRDLDYDAALLKDHVREIWRKGMWNIFQSPSIALTDESKAARDRILAWLPFTLKTSPSTYPEDPYVHDATFFERLFHLRAPWRSFHYTSNANLTVVYDHYKKLWMKTYASTNKTLLSDAVFMWFEHTVDRMLSIVTEWEIHGIWFDEDDVWQNGIPSEIIPAEVMDSFEDDNLYAKRMFRHDHSSTSRMFYGLPVGFRLPGVVPAQEVSVAYARKELSEAVAKLSDDCEHCEYTMDQLARVANQYLRATAVEDRKSCRDPPTCSIWDSIEDTGDAVRVLDCAANEKNTDADPGNTGAIFFSGNSFIGVHDFGDAFYTRNRFEELVYDCNHKGGIKSNDECSKQVSHQVMICARRLLHHVSDPGTLVRTSRTRVDENTELSLDCRSNEVLRVTHVQIYVKKELSAYPKTAVVVPPIAYVYHRNDMKEKSLRSIKRKCDGQNHCSVYTNINDLSGHTTAYDLTFIVEQECAPAGCNPNLFEEKKIQANENEGLNWQCRNENEGILITSAVWDTRGSVGWFLKSLTVGPAVAFLVNEDDMNDKTLRHLRKHCQGKNKCDQIADLDGITGHSTWYQVFVEVKYKCMPCQEFIRN